MATARRLYRTLASTCNSIPASFLRGGTSKGIFINAKHLPRDDVEWTPIFLGIMGSPDPEYGRQLNGMGGGVSSLSKIMVVEPPLPEREEEGIDVEYTFAQVGIRDTDIDYSGNCGNLTSMVGVFAVDEGICKPQIHLTPGGTALGTVRLWNRNTEKAIYTTFPVDLDSSSKATARLDLPQVNMAGVPGKASQITLDFVDPAGSRTGKLLPTRNPIDYKTVTVPSTGESFACEMSLVDATNPTVFVSSESLFAGKALPEESRYLEKELLEKLEAIRRVGAVAMNLNPAANAQPKVAVLGLPTQTSQETSEDDDASAVDIDIQALSMGVLHRAVPMTVGLCLGVAAHVEGTIVHRIVADSRAWANRQMQDGMIRIRHPSGVVDVGAEVAQDGTVKSAKVVRTGRRLMEGKVWW